MIVRRLTAAAAVATRTLPTAVGLLGDATIALWPHGPACTRTAVEPQLRDELLRFNRHRLIYRYLDRRVLRNGFARVRYGECAHEYLLGLKTSAVTSFLPVTKSEWLKHSHANRPG